MNRKTTLLSMIFISIILIGSYFGSQTLFRLNKIKLNIAATPQDSIVIINSNIAQINDIYLQPGKYMISVIKDGYFEYRKEYDINKEIDKISIKLIEKTEKTISSLIFSRDYDKVIAKYPIVKQLPYDSFLIKISYSPDSTMSMFVVEVTAYEGYRKTAIDKIKDWGYQPSELNIKFKNYENPFKLWKNI